MGYPTGLLLHNIRLRKCSKLAISDIFKISAFKEQIEALKKAKQNVSSQNMKLEQDKKNFFIEKGKLKDQIATSINQNKDLIDKNKKLEEQANLKLSLHEMKPIELEQLISKKNQDIDKLNSDFEEKKAEIHNTITSNQSKIESLKNEIKGLENQKENIRADISDLEPDVEMSSYGLYKPQYDFSTTLEYKDELDYVRDEQKSMIKDKTAVSYNPNWLVNNSSAAGRKMNRNNIKAILRSFNNECTEAINKATYSNFDRIQKRINRSFEQHNKMYDVVDIKIEDDYLDLKLDELDIAFEYRQKVQEEKDLLREQRAQEREEKTLQKEIAAKRKKVDKEINHYSKAISELEQKSNEAPEDQGLQDEITKLKAELEQYHKQRDEVDYREQHATAGYVYIISNVGSFGKNVFKIGVTRRLEPMDRINELGSASVPFKFDVHALIFSEDAYKLETELHNRFSNNRVNKVNNRKEYFSISIEDVENELKKYSDVTVDFNEHPEADEYRETLALENAEN